MFSRFLQASLLLLAAACGGKLDPSGTSATSGKQVGDDPAPTNPPSSSTSSSGSTRTGCGGLMIPFRADFEDNGLTDSFTVQSPSAFSIEYAAPIGGSASLRVNPNKASYISRKIPSLCAVRLEFSIRVSEQMLKSGGNLARINAGSRRFTIILAPGGNLVVAQEIYTTDAIGMGTGQPIGALVADDPSKILLDIDLTTSKVTFGLSSKLNGSAPTVVSDIVSPESPLQAPAAITAVELGTTPGTQSDPKGVYWLDDISIQ